VFATQEKWKETFKKERQKHLRKKETKKEEKIFEKAGPVVFPGGPPLQKTFSRVPSSSKESTVAPATMTGVSIQVPSHSCYRDRDKAYRTQRKKTRTKFLSQ